MHKHFRSSVAVTHIRRSSSACRVRIFLFSSCCSVEYSDSEETLAPVAFIWHTLVQRIALGCIFFASFFVNRLVSVFLVEFKKKRATKRIYRSFCIIRRYAFFISSGMDSYYQMIIARAEDGLCAGSK